MFTNLADYVAPTEHRRSNMSHLDHQEASATELFFLKEDQGHQTYLSLKKTRWFGHVWTVVPFPCEENMDDTLW